MLSSITLRLGLATAIVGAGALAATETADAMSGYRWKNRPLLIFAPGPKSQSLARQNALLSGRNGALRDRDMVVIRVTGNRVRTALGGGPGRSAKALRNRYGVGDRQFRVILVGKDGGAKLSSGSPVAAQRIFRLIDSMPMRRQEMRRTGS
ncbi:MAG: DUF4174 domain-containing protein [Pseudomonadota bacterium]